MRRFHGPNALFQPIDEREIVSSTAKDCLAEMNVCLDKAGDYCAAFSVNHCFGCLATVANRGNAFAINEQVTRYEGVRGIHRDERAVLNED
jgi:hypothetical protein